jgi:Ecdysteroid kinase-like family
MRDPSLTAETLTRWLRDAGTMTRGVVTDVRVELEHDTPISKLVFLSVTYSSEAEAALPRSLAIKWPRLSHEDSEVQFYRQLAPSMAAPPVLRCLAAIQDFDTNILVLEDLRASHNHPAWPLPPSWTDCERAVAALAQVHAQWWESPTLGKPVGKLPTHESLTSMVQGVAAHLPAFMDTFGPALTLEARNTYERVFSSSLKPWLRLTDPHSLTIIHGDAHTWNFLFPRSGEGAAYVIDWQLWHVDVGARDLAYLMALHWCPSRRRELEQALLRHYHEVLMTHGVKNYSFDELWLDYRRGALRNLTMPIIFWNQGMAVERWWYRLECALASYLDLECEELL